MTGTLTTAALAGLGGMLGWGIADFMAKRTIDKIGDITSLFWGQLFGVVPLLAILASRPHESLRQLDPLWLGLFGVTSALSYLPVYVGFGKGQVSVLSPLFAIYAALVVALSALFLHDNITSLQWVAMAVVFLGGLLLSTDLKDLRAVINGKDGSVGAGVPEILAAMIAYSIWLVLLDYFISGRDWVLPMLCIRSVSALTLLVYARVRKLPLTVGDSSLWPWLVAIGFADVAAFSSVAYGFSATSHPGVVAMLSSTFSLPTLILARFFLKERLNSTQVVAAATVLAGVAMVSVQ